MNRADLEALAPRHARPNAQGHRRAMLDRVEHYLNVNGPALSAQQAAIRLRVSRRTIVRYRKLLRGAAGHAGHGTGAGNGITMTSPPQPPGRNVAALESAPGGFVLLCDCSYATQVVVEIGPQVPELTEIAITCRGCQTTHWATIRLTPKRPIPGGTP